MKIENVDFNNNLILAPMAGVSDVGFRALASSFGADATYSEMLSCRAMLHNPKKTSLMTIIAPQEKIKVGQIFGHEPQIMEEALSLNMLDMYDIIDINMGCPAPKIVKNGEGSALMKNLPLASKIIEQCVRATDKPLTVKFRLGFDSENYLDFGRMCQDSGAKCVCLHGRLASQGYSGRANLDAIASLKSKLDIPVIGNGDVVDEESYQRMLLTGVDGVMIGRGAQGKPWIFSQLLGNNVDVNIYEVAQKHVDILRQFYDEEWLTLYMRKHFLWYVSSIPCASEVRLSLATSKSIDDSLKILKDLFSK